MKTYQFFNFDFKSNINKLISEISVTAQGQNSLNKFKEF